MPTFNRDIGEVKVGTPLHDGAQNRSTFVDELLAIVEDMPARILPGTGHAAAIAAFAAGLRSIADDLDPADDDSAEDDSDDDSAEDDS